MTHSNLGQRIADAVISEFEKLGPVSGKPIVRSNGVVEWTVLAGIVAISNDNLAVVSLATGVKSMPDEVRKYSKGSIVHDMHAEILCLRLLNRYLMEEISNDSSRILLEPIETTKSEGGGEKSATKCCDVESGEHRTQDESASVLESDKKAPDSVKTQFLSKNVNLQLKRSTKLALYISEPPCGDASMSHIAGAEESWTEATEIKEPATKKAKINRGRANFGALGVVRTKPGRADSKITYSKSCSDKLCLKQYTGILNCITSLRVAPIYLDYLVLGSKNHHEEDFERCFRTRMSEPPARPLQILTFADDKYKYGKSPEKSPSPLSLAHCAVTQMREVLNNGVKNGAFTKKKPPKPHGRSGLCRRSMWVQASEHIAHFDTYSELKAGNKEREALKKHVREIMGSWPESSPENFEL